jgi:hypothetical protein
MEQNALNFKMFEPEMYCLRCRHMEWDEIRRCCANFDRPLCPLSIKEVLSDLQVKCLVI